MRQTRSTKKSKTDEAASIETAETVESVESVDLPSSAPLDKTGKRKRSPQRQPDPPIENEPTTGSMLSLPSIVLVCLLRGVNIGGSKPMKMATLSQLFTKLGFLNVKTYIQSGNVVFSRPESHAIPMSDLMKHIQENIDDEFGYSNLPLSIRTFEEIQSIVTGNPYLNRKGVDPKRLHVTFLASPMASSTIEAFPSELKADLDELITLKDTYSVTTSRREVYLHTPNGYARTKVENNAIEKALGIAATTRNWNTCNKLYEMMKL